MRAASLSVFTWLLAVAASGVHAEPYLAVQTGMSCGTCHFNPTGGGLRTTFGNGYAQQLLSARPLGPDAPSWSGSVLERFRVGANGRYSARQFEFDDRDDNLDFSVDRVSLYAGAELSDVVSLYVDQQVAPAGSLNREAWAKLNGGNWYVKAGRMFLPFGWRVEDDTALIREISGINMTQGDTGVELGYARGNFNAQIAATNGNGGADEIDDGKQFSARAEWVGGGWRLGASAARNDTDLGNRTLYGIFAGLKTGRIAWLAEFDALEDEGFGVPDTDTGLAFLEANITLARGHNLKLTAEAQLIEGAPEDRYRGSVVYEYFPWPFAQLRAGVRARDSNDDLAALNSEEAFVQLHVFF